MKPAAAGAFLFMSYDMMLHYFRHHDEAPNRPRIVDHTLAVVILSTLGGAYFTRHPGALFASSFLGLMFAAPMSWYLANYAKPGSNFKYANIFYENGCTPEEIERFRHQDMVEDLGQLMIAQPGCGYVPLRDARGL